MFRQTTAEGYKPHLKSLSLTRSIYDLGREMWLISSIPAFVHIKNQSKGYSGHSALKLDTYTV